MNKGRELFLQSAALATIPAAGLGLTLAGIHHLGPEQAVCSRPASDLVNCPVEEIKTEPTLNIDDRLIGGFVLAFAAVGTGVTYYAARKQERQTSSTFRA